MGTEGEVGRGEQGVPLTYARGETILSLEYKSDHQCNKHKEKILFVVLKNFPKITGRQTRVSESSHSTRVNNDDQIMKRRSKSKRQHLTKENSYIK